ncbi:hypothetical protein [Dinoroseobacter sp. S124A]|uniref:hypothetical protein n=1 Tax=Dinoroseobacter sp. S124A TaxID=3415128 RepID=UPI003C7DD8CA
MMTKTPRWLTAMIRATEDEIPPMPYARGTRRPASLRAMPNEPVEELVRRVG